MHVEIVPQHRYGRAAAYAGERPRHMAHDPSFRERVRDHPDRTVFAAECSFVAKRFRRWRDRTPFPRIRGEHTDDDAIQTVEIPVILDGDPTRLIARGLEAETPQAVDAIACDAAFDVAIPASLELLSDDDLVEGGMVPEHRKADLANYEAQLRGFICARRRRA